MLALPMYPELTAGAATAGDPELRRFRSQTSAARSVTRMPHHTGTETTQGDRHGDSSLEPDVTQQAGRHPGRQSARQLAKLLGFGAVEQTRIAAAVFEVAYNACRSLGRVRLHFELTDSTLRVFPASMALAKRESKDRTNARTAESTRWDSAGIVRLADYLSRHPRNISSPLLELAFPLGMRGSRGLCFRPALDRSSSDANAPPDLFEEIRQQNAELLHTLGAPPTRRSLPSAHDPAA